MYNAGDVVMCLGGFNGHGGKHIDGFNRAHEGYGLFQKFGNKNVIGVLSEEGIMCVKYLV